METGVYLLLVFMSNILTKQNQNWFKSKFRYKHHHGLITSFNNWYCNYRGDADLVTVCVWVVVVVDHDSRDQASEGCSWFHLAWIGLECQCVY